MRQPAGKQAGQQRSKRWTPITRSCPTHAQCATCNPASSIPQPTCVSRGDARGRRTPVAGPHAPASIDQRHPWDPSKWCASRLPHRGCVSSLQRRPRASVMVGQWGGDGADPLDLAAEIYFCASLLVQRAIQSSGRPQITMDGAWQARGSRLVHISAGLQPRDVSLSLHAGQGLGARTGAGWRRFAPAAGPPDSATLAIPRRGHTGLLCCLTECVCGSTQL